jgi:transcriptional regulator GlxA family with amidase domain
MQYLTDWRTALARDHLRTSAMTLAQVAELTDYGSPCAFATAFHRHHQQAPGSLRQQERAHTAGRPKTAGNVHIY